ncbi:hypothetical protein QL285_047843 [Trifolium repens]|nr:hypothetical protein QL285_047843 [Trifolium repens]
MSLDFNLSPSDAHPESMDFLSLAWCNFAVQALKPEPQHGSLVLLDNPIKQFDPSSPIMPHPKSARMDDADFRSMPPLKSNNDLKSWIWMQQAMHPELNYNSSSLRKKWMPWKQILPLKSMSIKKWFKEIKMKKKEEQRLQRAEVHAAMSIAGVAAALSAIASENSKNETNEDRDAAIASATALVAAQCAKVAEAMGAKKEDLRTVIGSAINGTSASDILTLTAAAATSLKGAATLKVRSGCKNRLSGGAPILPIENNYDLDFDFEKGRLILAQGAELYVESPEGKYMPRSVSVILNSEAKVVLMMRKHNLLKSKKESIIMNMHAELYKGSESEDDDTCYLIVLATRKGTFKLDMVDDIRRYKTWVTTINHMLKISTSFAKYELQFY